MFKENFKNIFLSILNSYSLIFFSESLLFSFLILIATFFELYAGISGLLSVIFINSAAYFLGFDKIKIIKGYYGFNALLVGLGIGLNFEFTFLLMFVLFVLAITTLVISVVMEGILGKYYLPYLSFPFLFAIWIAVLSFNKVGVFQISQHYVSEMNKIIASGGNQLLTFFSLSTDSLNLQLKNYFSSLSSIFFLYSYIPGIIVAVGLLIHSRIAFSLSVIGFLSSLYFYHLMNISLQRVPFYFMGFNFILFAIAVGSYFLIPSKYSYLTVIVFMPAVVLLNAAFALMLEKFGIPVYSLTFNVAVLGFIYMLKLRTNYSNKLLETPVHFPTPEKSLYSYLNNNIRFKNKTYFALRLPFYGEWNVSQGYDGKITHKDKWKHALDFVIRDESGSTFKNGGDIPEDYYCFNKAVLSPADGEVMEILDGIKDNEIGDVNLEENWGNTIVIKHSEYFYSQLSHLKAGSFKVSKGDFVKAGQYLAVVGNSGRSPEPHLHFQLQAVSEIGAETIYYPIGRYLLKEKNNSKSSHLFKEYSVPKENDKVSNHHELKMLVDAFHFTPGKKMTIRNEDRKSVEWKVETNMYNESYIVCGKSKAKAFFKKEDNLFYFYDFKGSRNSLLYKFFLALYKVPLGYYDDMIIKDTFAIFLVFNKFKLFFQDFIAPFFVYLKAGYKLNYEYIDNHISPSTIKLKSALLKGKNEKELMTYSIEINRDGIQTLSSDNGKVKIEFLK